MFVLGMVSCGGIDGLQMDITIPTIISTIVNLIKIGIPILLIIFGMLDLGKAVMAQKEDEIKKSQQMFLKRLLSAALVFFVVMIVQVVFNLIGGSSKQWECVNCFINGPTEAAKEAVEVNDKVISCRK